MTKPIGLSDTARALLAMAHDRADHLAHPPRHLPAGSRSGVVRSLLKRGLLEEVPTPNPDIAWRTDEGGSQHALRATAAGLAVVQPNQPCDDVEVLTASARIDDAEIHVAPVEPSPAPRALRAPTQAVLAAWDDPVEGRPGLADAIEVLRAALSAGRPACGMLSSRQHRPNTKRAVVLALLRRSDGATVAQVADATGWLRHTVHGFFAGLKKAGIQVEVLERVRQVGAGQGIKGSYTVYRVAEAA